MVLVFPLSWETWLATIMTWIVSLIFATTYGYLDDQAEFSPTETGIYTFAIIMDESYPITRNLR